VGSEVDDVDDDEEEVFVGKDSTVWSNNPPSIRGRKRKRDITTFEQGPSSHATSINSLSEAFSCILPNDYLEKIVNYTNKFIAGMRKNYKEERHAKDIDLLN